MLCSIESDFCISKPIMYSIKRLKISVNPSKDNKKQIQHMKTLVAQNETIGYKIDCISDHSLVLSIISVPDIDNSRRSVDNKCLKSVDQLVIKCESESKSPKMKTRSADNVLTRSPQLLTIHSPHKSPNRVRSVQKRSTKLATNSIDNCLNDSGLSLDSSFETQTVGKRLPHNRHEDISSDLFDIKSNKKSPNPFKRTILREVVDNKSLDNSSKQCQQNVDQIVIETTDHLVNNISELFDRKPKNQSSNDFNDSQLNYNKRTVGLDHNYSKDMTPKTVISDDIPVSSSAKRSRRLSQTPKKFENFELS